MSPLRKHLVLAILSATAFLSSAAYAVDFLVPAYSYPSAGSAFWTGISKPASAPKTVAILNPNNGPGAAVNFDYTAAATTFKNAGGKLLGYVYSSYGARPIADVEADIRAYISFYPMVTGFFIDEMTNDLTGNHIAYYKTLYDYIKSLNATYKVVGNPGTNTDELYVSTPVVDQVVLYEDAAANYAAFAPASWVSKYAPTKFAVLVYSASVTDKSNVLNSLPSKNIRSVYVTDRPLPNPWDVLASYWDSEVATGTTYTYRISR